MSGNVPICMAEEYWANTQFSVARYFGRAKINGHEYNIVDKLGRNLWECSAAADRAGSDKAIPAGEPADLVRKDFIPYYKKLGRDKFLEVLKEHQTTNDKMLLAIYKEMTSKPKKAKVKQPNLFEENTQELAFAKGFKAGYEQGYKDAVIKACGWLLDRMWEKKEYEEIYVTDGEADSVKEFVDDFKKHMEE